MKPLLVLFTVTLAATEFAWGSFTYTESVREVHAAIHYLKLDEARVKLEGLKDEPGSIGFYHYLSQFEDALELLIDQDKAQYKPFADRCKVRRGKVEALKDEGPWKNYCLAEMDMYEALIHAKFNAMRDAAKNISSAYNLLSENEKGHPDFLPTYKTLGLLEAGIGTLPDVYRKMIGLMGYHGTIAGGYAKLNKALAINDQELAWVQKETSYLKMVVELYLMNDHTTAWKTINSVTPDHDKNLLAVFFRANTAMKCGMNDEAIRTLENRPKGSDYYTFQFLEFLLGTAKLYKLDTGADIHLLNYVNDRQNGDYVKNAYHKLTWYYTIFPDPEKYEKYRNLTISHGNITLEADKQALFEVLDEPAPDPGLLKVRCLFDGGYYTMAEEMVRPMKEKNFSNAEHRIEYNYRKGRVYQMQKDTLLARAFYLEAIERGNAGNSKSYYAAYSAYYIGEIYAERKETAMARKYYKLAIELGKTTNFKKSIEHKAKSALARLQD